MGKLGGIDLDLVEQKAVSILETKSKDVRALAFLSYVLLRKDRWEEIADLFDGFATLAGQSFEKLHPERPNAKMMAIKWLSEERFTDLVNQKKPGEPDYESIRRLLDSLGKLKPVLDAAFPNGSPFPSGLYGKAMMWEKSCKPRPQPVAPSAAPAQPAASASANSGTSGAVSAAAPAVMDSPKQAQTAVRTAARFLIEKEPQKPMGYRLMRSVRWDLLEKAPPAEGGKTQLSGPNPQQRTFFQNLLAQKDWKTLFDKSEEAFAAGSNHLWIDLQRLSATACKELGVSWGAIHSAILAETGLLFKRIPELLQLQFNDGSPMADDATRDWIQTDVAVQGASSGDGGAASAAAADPFEKETREVNALTAAGQIEKAVGLLQDAIRGSADEACNFRRTILIGSLFLKAKKPDIAMAVLETLDRKADAFHLDTWCPDLASEAWGLLAQAYRAGAAQKPAPVQAVLLEKHAAIMGKLCRVDPRRAFQLNTQTPQ